MSRSSRSYSEVRKELYRSTEGKRKERSNERRTARQDKFRDQGR